jgi:hypothetical protein
MKTYGTKREKEAGDIWAVQVITFVWDRAVCTRWNDISILEGNSERLFNVIMTLDY